MKKTKIPYQETGYFSNLISDYLGGKKELKPFYNQYPDIESFQKIIEERKQTPINRTILSAVLTEQNKAIEISEKVKSNIHSLNNDNCFTVTTGHQLNLFTGPLYFIYKIVTTINLAKELKENYPENEFIPVYWMATEDHDFEEINHINLFNQRYELEQRQSGAVGRMKLDGVEELIAQLKKDLVDRTGAEEIFNLLATFYQNARTYQEAIRGIVNHFFGKYGLVIIDGDDAQLKGLMKREFKQELLQRKNNELIHLSSEKLSQLGYKPQLTPREINLFYLDDELRERIVFEEGKYRVLNSSIEFTETEILDELNNHPERFSPNAPMRCMYQEKTLPNLAYIGGGGELAYWFQLKQMFTENKVSFPILVLRNSVLFIDKGNSKRLSKLEIQPTELFQKTDILVKNYLKKGADVLLELKEEEKIIATTFNDIVQKAGTIDASLQPMIKAELQKSLKSLKNIEGRLIKAEKQKEEVAVNQIKNLKEKLFPNNSLQERHDNIISLLLFYGFDVMDELIHELTPLDDNFVILELK